MDSNSIEAKLLLAAFSAAIGFLASMVLDRIKSRREPRRRLSWDAWEEKGILSIRPTLKEKVRFLYGSIEVKNLFLLRLKITNTGNRVVKNERVRIELPTGTQVIESHADPPPIEEVGLKAEEAESNTTRRVYTVGHLEVDQSVDLICVISGENIAGWAVYGHNEEGDVVFSRRDVARKKEDWVHFEPFLRYLLLFFIVPPLVRGIVPFGGLAAYAAYGVRVILFVLLAMHFAPSVRVLAQVIAERATERLPATSVTVAGESKPNIVVAQSIAGGEIRFETSAQGDGPTG